MKNEKKYSEKIKRQAADALDLRAQEMVLRIGGEEFEIRYDASFADKVKRVSEKIDREAKKASRDNYHPIELSKMLGSALDLLLGEGATGRIFPGYLPDPNRVGDVIVFVIRNYQDFVMREFV